jgi:hypothetical protein
MINLMDFPLLVFLGSFIALWASTRFGERILNRHLKLDKDVEKDMSVILGSALTLLGLIIGFSFSMAVSRYDQRKNLEEEEANAIGTEYSRADLLPSADAARVRALLTDYTKQRILFYVTRNEEELQKINAQTAQLQTQLWSAVLPAAAAHPTQIVALVVSGMNDVLNSQGYTQAAWWNRIPISAWSLLTVISICCHLLLGYSAGVSGKKAHMLLALPFLTSVSFFLIADIDSPRGGIIRVSAQNLVSTLDSMRPQ